MTLTAIGIFLALGLSVRLLPRARNWLVFAISVLAVFALQPSVPVRGLDYWLPLASLAAAGLGWLLTSTPEARAPRENWIAAAGLTGAALLVALTRFLPEPILTPTRPPQMASVLAGLALAAIFACAAWWAVGGRPAGRKAAGGEPVDVTMKPAPGRGSAPALALILVLLALFVVLKSPALHQAASGLLRGWVGQSAALATPLDLRWLGFSYLAFRLIHTARDRQEGRLPAVTLREYVTYAVFAPALTAGPIDRLERFVKDLRRPLQPDAASLAEAGKRIAIGLLRKFVLADFLALIALDAASAGQVRATGWAWVLVYAYSLQIYLDFAGYTDIAIGLGMLVGVRLPENFNAPYTRLNLTQFWNNWHMTLTQWFRAYFFNPLTRALRGGPCRLSAPWVILITQVSTFVLIGLWHGITWNFVIWGVWHGLGQFLQNRFSDWAKRNIPVQTGWRGRGVQAANWLLTFHYVALGWVWFALPTPELALRVMSLLFGG
jgi:D-alanyl-lipoteichoic acid acyltransferase DltB (MBOAT superfamily)